MAHSIWRLEERCYDKDSGLGRTAALGELVKGIKLKDGETAALSVNPARALKVTESGYEGNGFTS